MQIGNLAKSIMMNPQLLEESSLTHMSYYSLHFAISPDSSRNIFVHTHNGKTGVK